MFQDVQTANRWRSALLLAMGFALLVLVGGAISYSFGYGSAGLVIAVAFAVVPSVTNYSGAVTFSWNFGDGSPTSTNQFPSHTYASLGVYNWSVTATASNLNASASGSIGVSGPAKVEIVTVGGQTGLVLPNSHSVVIEETATLGANAQWKAATNLPPAMGGVVIVPVPESGMKFYRVRQAW